MNQVEFKVRPVEPSEAGQLTQLAHLAKAYWGYSPEFMEAVDNELTIKPQDLENERYLFRVGTCNGKICGFYTLDMESGAEGCIEMVSLFVEPAHIGKGYGRRMFEHSIEQAERLGASCMIIRSDPYAEKFYNKMGAVKLKEVASRSVPDRIIPLLRYDIQSDSQ